MFSCRLPQTFDLRGNDLDVIENAWRSLDETIKLVQLEHALLQQYRGANHPSVKKVSERLEAFFPAVTLVEYLHEIRRSVNRIASDKDYVKEFTRILLVHLDNSEWGLDLPSNLPNGLTILAISPRESSIVELGKLGAEARDALPQLKKELESKNKSIAAAAEKAIKQIEAAKDEETK